MTAGGTRTQIDAMSGVETKDEERGSSPVGRGGAGAYIEGELGAFYLLARREARDRTLGVEAGEMRFAAVAVYPPPRPPRATVS